MERIRPSRRDLRYQNADINVTVDYDNEYVNQIEIEEADLYLNRTKSKQMMDAKPCMQ